MNVSLRAPKHAPPASRVERADDAQAAVAVPGAPPPADHSYSLGVRFGRWLQGPMGNLALGVCGVLSFVALWQAAVSFEWVSTISVPPPSDVYHRFWDLIGDERLPKELTDTLKTWALSLLFMTLIMVPVGLLVGYIGLVYRPMMLFINIARSIPSTALIPISIMFFGLGFEMKFALVCYSISWPICLNSMYGVRNTEPGMLLVAQSLRWGRMKTLFRVVLPSAAPYIATGLRIASASALVVTLAAEFLGASTGIGTLIVRYQQAERPDFVFAGIALVGLIGMTQYFLLTIVERKVLPWAEANR